MSDKEALKIHMGISDSDSDSGKSEFDEEYYQNKPPPLLLSPSQVVRIKADDSVTQKQPSSHTSSYVNNDSNVLIAAHHAKLYQHQTENRNVQAYLPIKGYSNNNDMSNYNKLQQMVQTRSWSVQQQPNTNVGSYPININMISNYNNIYSNQIQQYAGIQNRGFQQQLCTRSNSNYFNNKFNINLSNISNNQTPQFVQTGQTLQTIQQPSPNLNSNFVNYNYNVNQQLCQSKRKNIQQQSSNNHIRPVQTQTNLKDIYGGHNEVPRLVIDQQNNMIRKNYTLESSHRITTEQVKVEIIEENKPHVFENISKEEETKRTKNTQFCREEHEDTSLKINVGEHPELNEIDTVQPNANIINEIDLNTSETCSIWDALLTCLLKCLC